jgi:BirA family biotin operon repressor/biotin-[acetyl-CoA-carboxylase] ligase
MSTLDLRRVDEAIRGTQFHGRLHHYQIIDSTQTQALADAQAGAPGGQVYIADEQTAGRGRGGHTWQSEPDRGLYITVMVRPAVDSHQALRLSLAAGLAAQHAIAEVTQVRIDLRWPNDLVMPSAEGHSRKLGGILTESASSAAGMLRYAAIGIGINLNHAGFPQEIVHTATSLRIATGSRVVREDLAAALLRALDAELAAITDAARLLQRFTEASSWAHGKRVHVAEDAGYTGTTAGLTPLGLLRVACDDGTERVVRHGGVREL